MSLIGNSYDFVLDHLLWVHGNCAVQCNVVRYDTFFFLTQAGRNENSGGFWSGSWWPSLYSSFSTTIVENLQVSFSIGCSHPSLAFSLFFNLCSDIVLFLVSSFPFFLCSIISLITALLSFFPSSCCFFNPVTLKSYKHLHVISPHNITPKSKNLKKWSATRCEGALAG